jgi:hypothetical protein
MESSGEICAQKQLFLAPITELKFKSHYKRRKESEASGEI